MKMRRMISIVLVLALAMTLAACGGSAATKMTMGTGGTSGTYYAFGGVLGQYIKNHAGIDVTVVSTDGSKANIESIAAGDYQLGTVQSDVMAYACDIAIILSAISPILRKLRRESVSRMYFINPILFTTPL